MAFFDLPLKEVFDQNVPLRFLIKEKIDALEERLFEARSFSQKKAIVEEYLIQRLRNFSTAFEFDRIRHSIHLINRAKGQADIQQLAAEACLSRKQHERIFGEHIGASPKHFLRMVRFQHSLFQKSIHPELSLTSLAYDSGYYDQSHMIREFKAFSGMTPRQFFSFCPPVSDYFQTGY